MRQRYLIYALLSAVLLTGGYLLRQNFTETFSSRLALRMQDNLLREYDVIEAEALTLLPDTVRPASQQWDESRHFFVQVDSSGIMAWNKNDYIPEAALINMPGSVLFLSNQRGDFLIRKWQKPGGFLVNVLALRTRYPIANGFLMPYVNDRIFPASEIEIVGPGASEGEPVRLGSEVVFRVRPGPAEARDNYLSFLVLLAGFVMLALSLNEARKRVEGNWGTEFALVGLTVVVYAWRQLMVALGFPSLYLQSDMFDPRVFASSPINATLGDLLLNAVCVLILVLYLYRQYSSFRTIRWLLHQGTLTRAVFSVIFLTMALLAVLFSFNFIEVIYHNSAQSLDISQPLNLTWVRASAFLSVMLGTVSSFLFIHVMTSLTRHLAPSGWLPFIGILLVATILFAAQAAFTGNDNRVSLGAGLILLLAMRGFRFDRLDFGFSFRVLLYVVFAWMLFSIHHAVAVRDFHKERMIRDQFRYAKDFLTERDVLGEYLLDQVRRRVAGDPFIQTRMASPFFSRASVVEKVRRVHLNRYFDRYEQMITTAGSVDSMIQQAPGWLPTGYPGVYYSTAGAGDALKKYHVSVPIHYQRNVGSVEVDLVLKRVLPDNVFPELLVDNRFSQLYRNRDFSFAVFRQDQVVNSFGAFHYERDFDMRLLGEAQLFQSGLTHSGYCHVGIEESDGSIAVVSSADYPVSALITNSSFWFVLGLVLLLFTQGFLAMVALLAGHQFAYTARIQLFMFLAFALPMAAVSVTTLTMMAKSNEENTAQEFLDRSTSAAVRLSAILSKEGGQEAGLLEGWIAENATFAQTDISVYSPNGKLQSTSQPSLFDNHLISTLMSREAFKSIVVDGRRHAICSEQIGTLEYSSVYAGAFSPQTGKLLAVVSLPFFESASYLQRAQARVLATILQVFVVVFLVFTLLSFLAAESLSSPIRFMTKTLRQTTLGGENKPLTWSSKDEMGILVLEYNRMVSNLQESRKALAQSEKESAWREMAKQVAHEIKNPLTPMKLTLQQLAIENEPRAEKTKKAVEVMLRQVEILDTIASSFSTLARMPALSPLRTDLVKLVTQATSLFLSSSEGTVEFVPPNGPFWVSVDPKALTRAMSNVLINAMQARKEGERAIVEVRLVNNNGNALITIRDNGRGVPDALQERIFQPKFTTKESGSGLGLYMAHQFVIQSGGRIWFTTSDQGTTFFIEFPLLPA